MSDFVENLLSRNFTRSHSPEGIRPRLPSLFETPAAGRSAFGTSFAGETAQPDDQTDLAPESYRTAAGVMAPEVRPVFNEIGGQSNGSRPSLEVFQRGERDEPDQQTRRHDSGMKATQPRDDEQNRDASIDRKWSSHLMSPLFKAEDADRNRRVNAQADFADSPAITPFAVKPDGKTPWPEPSLSPTERKKDFEQKAASRTEIIKDLAGLTVDPTVLERIVTDKMALHARQEPFSTHKGTSLSAPTQAPLLAPIDTAKLGVQWPSGAKSHLFSNQRETLAEPSEPVINVTIGRIEIRATQAAPINGRKSQTPKASTMSLDDYLKQRNGGKP
jgi:hypothetical protein